MASLLLDLRTLAGIESSIASASEARSSTNFCCVKAPCSSTNVSESLSNHSLLLCPNVPSKPPHVVPKTLAALQRT